MTKTQELISETYNGYFSRLKAMAAYVEEMKKSLKSGNNIPPTVKDILMQNVSKLEDEMLRYADELEKSGVRIYKNVA